MVKYILAALVIIIAWAAALILKEKLPHGIEIAIAVTILTVLVLVGIVLYRKWRARKAAREIEKALNAQAEEQARTVRPEQQAEVRAMQAEFNRAVQSLKSTKLAGKGGVEALYALPWYVIIGPPGAGKTTALKNSGLQFPYLNARTGGGVKGVGGTRNCEWWFTNEAVLLDTAGRYTTQDDDRDEWFSFLDLLKRNRPEMPLNGLIVAVSVADLLGAKEHEIDRVARNVRERVDEVMNRLQMVLPVYVLFTKVDLVQGFSEFFNDLKKNDRGQMWGYTVPLAEQPTSPGQLFGERFDEMVTLLDGRRFRRIATEQRLESRENVYQFPQQFRELKQSLSDFLENAFAGNQYQGAPRLRGVYFTSGTQEGRPIDRLTQKLRETLNLPAVASAPQQQPTEAKSFFLRDVFAKVVFPDAEVAARSPAELARQRRQRYLFAAGAVAAAMLISILPAYAYLENKEYIERASTEVEAIAQHTRGNTAAPLALGDIEPVRARVTQLRDWETGRVFIPLYMRFGMYKGSDIYPHISRMYALALRHYVIEPIARQDLVAMQQVVAAHDGGRVPTRDVRTSTYNVLKLHLLMTVPHANGEPSVASQKAFMQSNLAEAWTESLGASATGHENEIRANVGAYLDQVADQPALSLQRDARTVVGVRDVINRGSQFDLALNSIIDAVSHMGLDVSLQSAIGRDPLYMSTTPRNVIVRGAFTREGWEQYVRDRLKLNPEELTGEAWVTGRNVSVPNQQRIEEDRAQLKSQYFEAYIAEWRHFMSSIRVNEPRDADAALQMLQWLTQGGRPAYEQLMYTLARNVNLLDPDEDTSNAAGSAVGALATTMVRARVQAQGRLGMLAAAGAESGLQARRNQQGDVVMFTTRQAVGLDPMLHGLVEFGVPPPPPPQPAAAAGSPPPAPPAPAGPTRMREYLEQLAFVRDPLQTHLENPAQPTAPLITALQTANTRVESLINNADVDARPPLRLLLPPPLEFTVRRTLGGIAGGSSDRWCSAVVVPYFRTLHDHYPFNPAGQDLAIADLKTFYNPDRGALWAFYNENLATDVPRTGDQFDFAQRFGESMSGAYRPELRIFLNRSNDITTVMWPNGPAPAPRAGEPAVPPADLGVDFEARLRPSPEIAELTFTVDGQEIQYRNGPPEWSQFHWPAQGRMRGAKIRARGRNGIDETIEQDGEWGLFRLFEAGVARGSPEARIFSVEWRLRDQSIVIGVDVRPARSENPFFGVPRRDNSSNPRFLQPFRGEGLVAPHPIARLGHPCNLSGVPGAPRAPESSSGSHHRRHHHDG